VKLGGKLRANKQFLKSLMNCLILYLYQYTLTFFWYVIFGRYYRVLTMVYNRSSFRNVVFFHCYLGKIRTMDKVRKPSISVCNIWFQIRCFAWYVSSIFLLNYRHELALYLLQLLVWGLQPLIRASFVSSARLYLGLVICGFRVCVRGSERKWF
jgi:hypothetical protein